jgi:hypothetical protein
MNLPYVIVCHKYTQRDGRKVTPVFAFILPWHNSSFFSFKPEILNHVLGVMVNGKRSTGDFP